MACKIHFLALIALTGLVCSVLAQDEAAEMELEKQLFSKLFAPNAPVLPTAETYEVLEQLQNIYKGRMDKKTPATMEEMRRRMQVFSLASMGDVNQVNCKADRFYAYKTSIQFLSQFKNVQAYLINKEADQIQLCKDSNLEYVDL